MSGSNPTINVRYAGVLGSFKLDVAFEAPMRGITALFGPSGCGKTTILRCVAGLNRLRGRLAVGSDVWQDDASGQFRVPYERPVGYVFQEASLFAHLSVRRNLLYGHRRALKAGVAEEIRLDDVVVCSASHRCSIAPRERYQAVNASALRLAARSLRSRGSS
jgi:molybdate transport system ATP-binding protein